MVCNEGASSIKIIRALECKGLDLRLCALDQSNERSCGRHLDNSSDSEICHRLHAEIPTDRPGNLTNDPVENFAPIGDRRTIFIREKSMRRCIDGQRSSEFCENRDCWLHYGCMESARDCERTYACTCRWVLCKFRKCIKCASGHDLSCAILICWS